MELTGKQGRSLGFDLDKNGRWVLNLDNLNPVLRAELMLGEDDDDDEISF